MKTYMEEEKPKKYYITIYIEALRRFDMRASEAMLAFLIVAMSKKKGYCYASKKWLARQLFLCPATVFNLLALLKSKGLIKSVGHDRNRARDPRRLS